jgi:hypothetical protein
LEFPNHDGKSEATEKDHKYTANVLDTERVGLKEIFVFEV